MPRTRTAALAILACTALLFALAGCTPDSPDVEIADPDEIRVSGSGTALPLVRLLADAYPDEDVVFVYLPGVHSGGGIRGVALGEVDLGAISRYLEPGEREYDLTPTMLATDALAIAVHPDVGVDALTSEQVRAIFEGRVADWSAVGGPELTITVLDRPEDESAKIVLRDSLLGDSFVVTEDAVQLYYEPDMLEGIVSTPGSIGYISLGMAVSTGADLGIVALDGVTPGVDTIADGSYTLARDLGVVVASDAQEHVGEFVEWTAGHEAAEAMIAGGYSPYVGR